jgi:HK97 family phage major capsid protein
MSIPKVATGTAVAAQATQNTPIQQTDITTTSVSSNVVTLAGGQTISMQLVEQSPVATDQIILRDLAADYGRAVGAATLNGLGTGGTILGLLNQVSIPTVTYTDATPTLLGTGKMISKIGQAIQTVETSLFVQPDAIVMHPRRWAWAQFAQFDSSNRPIFLPAANGPVNAFGVTLQSATGLAGYLGGIPVYVDPAIPTNLGAGTNQDLILVMKRDESWFWESNLRLESYPQTCANQLSLYLRCYSYIAQVTQRVSSLAVVSGTGFAPPVF